MEKETAYLQPNVRDTVIEVWAEYHENTEKKGTISENTQLLLRNVETKNKSGNI